MTPWAGTHCALPRGLHAPQPPCSPRSACTQLTAERKRRSWYWGTAVNEATWLNPAAVRRESWSGIVLCRGKGLNLPCCQRQRGAAPPRRASLVLLRSMIKPSQPISCAFAAQDQHPYRACQAEPTPPAQSQTELSVLAEPHSLHSDCARETLQVGAAQQPALWYQLTGQEEGNTPSIFHFLSLPTSQVGPTGSLGQSCFQ